MTVLGVQERALQHALPLRHLPSRRILNDRLPFEPSLIYLMVFMNPGANLTKHIFTHKCIFIGFFANMICYCKVIPYFSFLQTLKLKMEIWKMCKNKVR